MKKLFVLSVATLLSISDAVAQDKNGGYPITQVPFTSVKVTQGTFWGQSFDTILYVNIRLVFSKCEETHL